MDNELTLLVSALVMILAIVAAAAYITWFYRRAAAILQRWAQENDFQIVSSEPRILSRGPFFWTSSNAQVVYYVTVIDMAGRTRRGYVRCGSFWGGILSDKAEVRWDESSSS